MWISSHWQLWWYDYRNNIMIAKPWNLDLICVSSYLVAAKIHSLRWDICTMKTHNILSSLRLTFFKGEAKTIENTWTFKKWNKISQNLKIDTLALNMHTCNLDFYFLPRNFKLSGPCTSGNKYRMITRLQRTFKVTFFFICCIL